MQTHNNIAKQHTDTSYLRGARSLSVFLCLLRLCLFSASLFVFCVFLWSSASFFGLLRLSLVFCVFLWSSASFFGLLREANPDDVSPRAISARHLGISGTWPQSQCLRTISERGLRTISAREFSVMERGRNRMLLPDVVLWYMM